jgi:hypothetical protein
MWQVSRYYDFSSKKKQLPMRIKYSASRVSETIQNAVMQRKFLSVQRESDSGLLAHAKSLLEVLALSLTKRV